MKNVKLIHLIITFANASAILCILPKWMGTYSNERNIYVRCDRYKKNPVPNEFVRSLYNKLLGREPEPGAIEGNAIHSGKSNSEVIIALLRSEEYSRRIVGSYYQAYLGRAPDEGRLRAWINLVEHELALREIIKGFITSDEYENRALSR